MTGQAIPKKEGETQAPSPQKGGNPPGRRGSGPGLLGLCRELGVLRLAILLAVALLCSRATFLATTQATSTIHYLTLSQGDLSHYDPYITHKYYYSPQHYSGYHVSLQGTQNWQALELVSSGAYRLEFLQNNQVVGQVTTLDQERQQVFVPKSAQTAGFDTLRLIPQWGNLLSLSYLAPQDPEEESVIFQEVPPRTFRKDSYYAQVERPDLVEGLFSHVVDYSATSLTLDVSSINEHLGCYLLDVTDSAGTQVAGFPAGSFLPAYDLEDPADPLVFTLEVLAPFAVGDLYLHYQYKGYKEVRSWEINPYAPINEELFQATQVRTLDNMGQFPALTVQDGVVSFQGETLVLALPLYIPPGYVFSLSPGQNIALYQNAFILSRSPIQFLGSEEAPITLTTPDQSLYSGLVVMEAEGQSQVNHVTFDGLGEVRSGAWMLTGAVTFYESDVIMDHCQFLNNRSEDGLNSIRGYIEVHNSYFYNSFQDAFDSDFCTGLFQNVTFQDAGNDAFDVSTSTFHLENCFFYDTWDKAISTGEASTVSGTNLVIRGAQSGLAAKDSSRLTVDQVLVEDVFIGVCVYQKKPEFGATELIATNYTLLPPYDFDYIIEKQDNVVVNGEQLVSSNNKKQEIIIQYMIEEMEIS